eukprot:CAMPEP_0194210316 /NCGR_PEP_ID=MMETSP0156-20130528/8153_1 /TAXON_ID=33649 /ORGANISM="Thalassionema nitzschioides, Strain L26-B" /LENGTH=130 /DNA_ID=CAMNT_0038937643 /DNA_START=40 /DNA_END=432 /DNA_ORIENTATION=-
MSIATVSARQLTIRSSTIVARSFSSTCEPAERLKCIFEEYRQKNYSRETPKRFKKELIKAACSKSQTEAATTVAIESLNQILINIGRPDQCLSEDDMNRLCSEVYGAHRTVRHKDGKEHIVSIDEMMKLI